MPPQVSSTSSTGVIQYLANLAQRSDWSVAKPYSLHLSQLAYGQANAALRVSEVEYKGLGTKLLNIANDRHGQMNTAQGMESCPRAAVLTVNMPKPVRERHMKILLPQFQSLAGDCSDNVVSVG